MFTEAAQNGYGPSQANLGLMYHKGDGVKPDIQKAIAFYEAAAKQGSLQSIFNLGQIYRKGDGVKPDLSKAVQYYKLAAETGHGFGNLWGGTQTEIALQSRQHPYSSG